MKLFEIRDEIERVLYSNVDKETGEITDETIEMLDGLEVEFDEKALAVAAYIKGERCEADAVKQQADLLATRAKSHAAKAERLESYLTHLLPQGRELRDATSWIKWTKSTSVLVDDEAAIPEEFMRIKTTRSPNRTEIAKSIKSGVDVPGCGLEHKQTMKVK